MMLTLRTLNFITLFEKTSVLRQADLGFKFRYAGTNMHAIADKINNKEVVSVHLHVFRSFFFKRIQLS